MLDIKEKRHIQIVGKGGGGQAESVEWDNIQNKPDFATVATSGNYSDLTDKPDLATVATSGSYNDLSDKPTILAQWFGTQAEYDAIVVKDPDTIYNIEGGGQVQANWTESDSSDPSFVRNKPTLATVATSGSYSDLSNTPNLATVATSGSYNDLTNKPAVKEDLDLSTLTQAQYVDFYTNYNTYKANYDLNWGGMPIVSINSWQPDTSISPVPLIVVQYGIYGQSALMTGGDDEVYFGVQLIAADGSVTPYSSSMVFKQICHTASYNDLVDKPTLATVATSGSYNDLSNKPEIPSVPAMATQELTFTLQGGTTKTIEFYTVPNYFYVEDASGTDNTLQIVCTSTVPSIEVFCSADRSNWTSMGTTSTTPISATIPANGKLYLKCTADRWGYDGSMHNNIRCVKNFNVGGNIMSLLYGDNFEGQTTINNLGAFASIFRDSNSSYWNKLLNAKDLILPATTLATNCYNFMFKDCTALTTAPALPATTLVQGCYQYMFSGCTALTTAPALPATTLANGCYGSMFEGCTALTTAPELPATTLANGCYENMFEGCTALTTAPALPATTLANYCYSYMFKDCTALNSVTTYATNISATQCTLYWLSNVASTGDFFNLGGITYPSGGSGIPSGWTEHTSL